MPDSVKRDCDDRVGDEKEHGSADSASWGDDSADDNCTMACDEEDARLAFAKLVCFEDISLDSVDGVVFKAVAGSGTPPLSADLDTVLADCLRVYEIEKLRIKERLRNFNGMIRLSLEKLAYGDTVENSESYLSLRARFVDDNWNLKNWVVCVSPGPGTFGAHETMAKLLDDLDIVDKISSFTTGSEIDCDEGMIHLQNHITTKKELSLKGQLFRAYCCSDMISSTVREAFDAISPIIHKISKLDSEENRTSPLWYLTLGKLKEAMGFEALGEYCTEHVVEGYDLPSPEEWTQVGSICQLLDRIYEVSRRLFVNEHLTTNTCFFHLLEFKAILYQECDGADSFSRDVASKMLKMLDKYLNDMFLTLAIGTVLDPRWKMRFIEFFCSKSEDQACSKTQTAVVSEAIHQLFAEYVKRFYEEASYECDSVASDEDYGDDLEEEEENVSQSPLEKQKRDDTHARPLEQKPSRLDKLPVLQEFQSFISSSKPPTSDLDWYLMEPVLPWHPNFNALTWWKQSSLKFPTLAKFARDYLTIPVSLASSDQAFSFASKPADESLAKLGRPDVMNAVMCTRSWQP